MGTNIENYVGDIPHPTLVFNPILEKFCRNKGVFFRYQMKHYIGITQFRNSPTSNAQKLCRCPCPCPFLCSCPCTSLGLSSCSWGCPSLCPCPCPCPRWYFCWCLRLCSCVDFHVIFCMNTDIDTDTKMASTWTQAWTLGHIVLFISRPNQFFKVSDVG